VTTQEQAILELRDAAEKRKAVDALRSAAEENGGEKPEEVTNEVPEVPEAAELERNKIINDPKQPSDTKEFLGKYPNVPITGTVAEDNVRFEGQPEDGTLGLEFAADLGKQMREDGENDRSRNLAENPLFDMNDPPSISSVSKLTATAGDFADKIGLSDRDLDEEGNPRRDPMSGELTPQAEGTFSQQKRDKHEIDLENWKTNAETLYAEAPTLKELGVHAPWWYTQPENQEVSPELRERLEGSVESFDGEIPELPKGWSTGTEVKVSGFLKVKDGQVVLDFVRVPNPNDFKLPRAIDQAGVTLAKTIQGWGQGFFNYQDAPINKVIPNYDVGAGEEFASEFISLAAPSILIDKTLRGGARATAAGLGVKTGTKSFRGMVAGSSVIAQSVAEAAMVDNEDGGVVVKPETMEKVFGVTDPKAASNLALIMENMMLNGAMDTVLLGVGALAGGAKTVGEGVVGFITPSFVRSAATQEAVLNVFKTIDTSLDNAAPYEVASKMQNLAVLLEHHSEALIRIGGVEGAVPLDTVNAMANSAELYIMATRPGRLIKDPEYVRKETKLIIDNTIAYAKSLSGTQPIRDAQASTVAAISDVVKTASEGYAPKGKETLNATGQDLLDVRDANVGEATTKIDEAKADIDAIESKINTAVSNDPTMSALLAKEDALSFFDNASTREELRKLLGDEVFKEYKLAWESVEQAYSAIPNEAIDTRALAQYIDELADSYNVAQGVNKGKGISAGAEDALRRIYNAMAGSNADPSIKFTGDSPASDAFVFLNLGYNDLYKAKQVLSDLRGGSESRGVSQQLDAFKEHIRSSEEGGQVRYLIDNNPNSPAAKMAQEADRLYAETQNRFKNSSFMENLTDKFPERVAGDSTYTPPGSPVRGQPDVDLAAKEMINMLPNGDTDVFAQQVRGALKQPELIARFDEASSNLFIGKGLRALAKELEGATSQTPSMILESFDQYAKVLKDAGNPQYQQIEEAAQRIKRLQETSASELEQAKALLAMAEKEKDQFNNTIIRQLFQSSEDSLEAIATATPTTTAQQRITEMLNGKNAGDRMVALQEQIDKIPDPEKREAARKAVKGAVLTALENLAFNPASPAAVGIPDVRFSKLTQIRGETSNSTLEGIRRTFNDEPHVVSDIEDALSVLEDTSIYERIRAVPVGSDTAPRLQIGKAMGSTFLLTLGYMNPTAAGARNLSSKQIKAMEELQRVTGERVRQSIFAAPKEFSNLLRMVARKEAPSKIGEARDLFWAASLVNLRVQSREEKDEGQRTNLERTIGMINSAKNNVRDSLLDANPPEGFE